MYRLDSQDRLKIPDTLLETLPYEVKSKVCAVCMDMEREEIYILPIERITKNDKVLLTRKVDANGRIFIKAVIHLLGKTQEYLIYLENEKIRIRGI